MYQGGSFFIFFPQSLGCVRDIYAQLNIFENFAKKINPIKVNEELKGISAKKDKKSEVGPKNILQNMSMGGGLIKIRLVTLNSEKLIAQAFDN